MPKSKAKSFQFLMSDEVLRLKESLRTLKEPLIGIEYLIFIKDAKNPQNKLICSLCDRKGEVNNMTQHFNSAPHRLKFLSKHFPSAANTIKAEDFRNHQNIFNCLLHDLSLEIESRLGRKTPFCVSEKEFLKNPEALKEKVKNGEHFQESPTSSLLMDLIMLIKTAQKRVESRKRSRSRSPDGRDFKFARTSNQDRGRSRSETSPLVTISPEVERYRRTFKRESDQITNKYLFKYKNHPESHPKYTEEWNHYWLQEYYKHGCDAKKIDSNVGWRVVWDKRSKELEEEEILKLRVKIRNEMNLPVEKSDLVKLDQIKSEEKLRIKERNPNVPTFFNGKLHSVLIPYGNEKKPLIDLDEISKEIDKKTAKLEVVNEEPKKLKDENENLGENSKTVEKNLSNDDVISLFKYYDHLNETSRTELLTFMTNLEINDPIRYETLCQANLTTSKADSEEEKSAKEDEAEIKPNSSLVDDSKSPPAKPPCEPLVKSSLQVFNPQNRIFDDSDYDEDDYSLEKSDRNFTSNQQEMLTNQVQNPCSSKNQKKSHSEFFFRPLNNVDMNVFAFNGTPICTALTCFVCDKQIAFGSNYEQHIAGYRHKKNLHNFENSIIAAEIKRKQSNFVGLEYLVELVKPPQPNLIYVCMLCGFSGASNEILDHFSQISHQKLFLQSHFPSLFDKIQDDKIIPLLCKKIDELEGRLQPMVTFYREFDETPNLLCERIEKGAHFNEKNCPELLEALESLLKELQPDNLQENESKMPSNQKFPSEDDKYRLATQYLQELSRSEIEKLQVSIKQAQDITEKYSALPSKIDLQISLEKEEQEKKLKSLSSEKNNVLGEVKKKMKEKTVLTVEEIKILSENFPKLSPDEREDFIVLLQNVFEKDPEKYKKIFDPY